MADVPALEACARAAYAKYVERIGREPAPMVEDFAGAVAGRTVHVIERDGSVIGYVVVRSDDLVTRLDNIAVLPAFAGQGVGRALLDFVEDAARRSGHEAVELYTNEKMTENTAMYPHLGYVETGRRREDGFDRVYFRKRLDRRDGPR